MTLDEGEEDVGMSAPDRFADLLRNACEAFEAFMQIQDGALKITHEAGLDPRMLGIDRALLDAFIFDLYRAYRLAKQAPDEIAATGVDVDSFCGATQPLDSIRNVTEHWRDEKKPRRPRAHSHLGNNIAVDETSLVIMGASKVYRGPANLYDLYVVAKELADWMRPRPGWMGPVHTPRS